MIRAILFDFDGVLTIDKTGSESIIRSLSEKSHINSKVIETNYYKYNQKLLNGTITHEMIWDDFCKQIGGNLNYNLLIQAFKETRLDQDMIAYVKELKQNYLIGMVTDNKADRIHTILDTNNLNSYFDAVSISAEIHSGKSEEHIFKDTLSKLKLPPQQCIFVDNTPKNLIIPSQMGMSTILFNDTTRNILTFRQNLQSQIALLSLS